MQPALRFYLSSIHLLSQLWLAPALAGKHITLSLQTLIDLSKTAYLIVFIFHWFSGIKFYGSQLFSCMIVHICLLRAA